VLILRRTTATLLGVLAISTTLWAQHETITIKSHSRGGKSQPPDRAFVYGEIEGKPITLVCVLSHADCKELPRGEYDIERLLEGEGSYPNCPNVDLYRVGADSFKEEPLGEYCVLREKN
jgi:hypothetical protein